LSISLRKDLRDVAEVVVLAMEGEQGFMAVVDGDGLGDLAGMTGVADAPQR
jgi:hypothetical protein